MSSRRWTESGFRAWLDTLKDRVADSRERGLPIRVPDPGTEHGRRLMEALGVELEEPDE